MPILAGYLLLVPEDDRQNDERVLGKISFWFVLVGILCTFMIQHVIGLDGMPRRVFQYDEVGHLALYNLISTIGAFILATGVMLTVINVRAVVEKGRGGRPRPMEGQLARVVHPSPPPVNNFDTVPVIRSGEPMKDIRREIERGPVPVAARSAAEG